MSAARFARWATKVLSLNNFRLAKLLNMCISVPTDDVGEAFLVWCSLLDLFSVLT
jgi:hypothetical protein